ncbi:MAG TPA: response regulator [Candidatus Angelobacter sp.]|nr:response regulator [Candidatus Angelobacter sp.]
MAKILVADDNSNIQKMVGLALKDQGIDVVAVGNGEAAVRKISDIRPDLVLADVFMPVRNGYEVCQYVKTDASLAHIPVILLVGAFDPLDEQEAQRVGADGVLKKPFVPPDPLISMVKSALQRAGVPHGPASEKPVEPEPLRAADLLTPSSPKVPTVGAFPVPEEPIAAGDESFVDEVPARPIPLRMDSGAQPVAFGSLLETPSHETEEESFVSSPPPDFAAERDWRDRDDKETEEEEEDEKPASWRRDEAESHAAPETRKGSKDWRAGGIEEPASGKSRAMGWEPEEEKPELVETAPAASNSVAPPSTTATTVVPETAPLSASPFGANPWAPGASSLSKEMASAETATAVEEIVHSAAEAPSATATPSTGTPEPVQAEPEKKETKEAWFSTASNPWDAEIKKASQLASTWDAPVQANAPAASSNGTEKATETLSEETKAVIEEAALSPAAVEAIREEAAQVAEHVAHATEQETPGDTHFYAHAESEEMPAAPAAATPSMDELVAKVLAKMSPEVLQAVTREILKPVVEAMVKEELKTKKS